VSVRRRSFRVDARTAAVALLAVVSIVTGSLMSGHSSNTSAKDRIEADPPPALFTDATIEPTARDIAHERVTADDSIQAWVAAHGTKPDDKAFTAWVEHTFPPPPADLAAQLPGVAALAATRDSGGVEAATWLEAFGKKDIWKLYAHDQGEMLTSTRSDRLKSDEKAALALAKQISDDLGGRFGSSAPYVRQPSLRPDHKVTPGQKCPCSYPSRHATAAAASETLLGHLQPHLDPQYRHMEAEIDYSRIYMAGHFPDDITAGALLGDLIGDYFLITREGFVPAKVAGEAGGR
jgi:PAP2 superfamily